MNAWLTRLAERATWEKVASTFIQSAGLALTTVDAADAVLLGALSAYATLVLALLPLEEPAGFVPQVLARMLRTWAAVFVGTLATATTEINASVWQAAGFAFVTALMAAVKGALGKVVGDPSTPGWVQEPEVDTPGVTAEVAAKSKNGSFLFGRFLQKDDRHPDDNLPAPGLRKSILKLTNDIREDRGLHTLRWGGTLAQSAQAHANDMASKHYFAHDSLNGTAWFKRIFKHGVSRDKKIAENIARGFSGASAVVDAWMRSPEHRKNMLDPKLRVLGVGYARNGGYWVQDFSS